MITSGIELTEEQLSAVTGGREGRHEGGRHHRGGRGWEGHGWEGRGWNYDDDDCYDRDGSWRTNQIVWVPTVI